MQEDREDSLNGRAPEPAGSAQKPDDNGRASEGRTAEGHAAAEGRAEAVKPFKYQGSGATNEERKNIVQRGSENLASRVRSRGTEGRHVIGQVNLDDPSLRYAADGATAITDDAPTLLLLCGSPRRRTCASLLDLVEAGARSAGIRTERFMLCEKKVKPCIGCNLCCKDGNCVYYGMVKKDGSRVDDYRELVDMLDTCDGLVVVAPVYFSGPPAQLKAVYDRFQPYWARKYVLGRPFPERRPAQVFMVGTGGDPHGNEPFTTISRSALQIAGFEMEKLSNYIGYLDPRDCPKIPSEDEAAAMSPAKLAKIKATLEEQNEFRRRALEAGKAFGRMLRTPRKPSQGVQGN